MLSRRQFLQFAGITLMSSALPGIALAADSAPVIGRALAAAPLYPFPNAQATPIRYLWPDSLISLTEAGNTWYRSDTGFIPRHLIQPVSQHVTQAQLPDPPFWAEVIAPVAPVWRWCAASAPLVTRIGHGGAVRVMDTLPDWVSVADESGHLLGWSQAMHWGPVVFNSERIPLDLVIENRAMTVYHQDQAVARAPVATGQQVPAGTYSLTRGKIGSLTCCPQPDHIYRGVSWQLRIGNEYDFTSVYWHNRFGEYVPGPGLQITPVLGRWLYEIVADGSTITIHHNT